MTKEPQNIRDQPSQEPYREIEVTVKRPVTVVSAEAPDARTRKARAGEAPQYGRGTLPGEPIEAERPRERKAAILVCHGMGQQVQFSTLNDVVNALVRAEPKALRLPPPGAAKDPDAGKKKIDVTLIRAGDSLLPRTELKLTGAGGSEYEVHLYEAYWAVLTEGKVTMMDVLKFLFSGGWDGLRFARKPFKRWMFNGPKDLPFTGATKGFLLIAALIVCSLTLLGFSLLIALGGKLIGLVKLASPDSRLIDLLVAHVFIFVIAILLAGGILFAVKWAGSKGTVPAHEGRAGELPKILQIVNVLSIVLLLLATLPVTASLLVHLGLWVVQAPNSLKSFWLIEQMESLFGMGRGDEGSLAAGRIAYLALWGASIIAYSHASSFFVRYVGDVAAYISAHKVSRFSEVRQQIKEVGLRMARAAYESVDHQSGQLEYDQLIVVGHSLGSVVAYDTVNAMINHDLSQNESLKVVERTKALITFGSPLDKTAFFFRAQLAGDQVDVRESLAAAVQPLIQSYKLRPRRWINIWSRLDWISGKLAFYDDPAAMNPLHKDHSKTIQNIEDLDASFPMLAHTEYWSHDIFGETLYRELMEACALALSEEKK